MGRKNAFQLDTVAIRLVPDTPMYSTMQVSSPETAINAVAETLKDMDREVVCAINLKTDGTPINCNIVSIGALEYCVAHPREVLKSGILSNAANMILVHSHPSGRLKPSKEDIRVTDRLMKIGDLIGIPLLDHIIVGSDTRCYFSFKEKGIMKNPCCCLAQDYHSLNWNKNAIVAERKAR